ncbi:MAG: aminoglycoside phosphotransferase family protein [Neobacillus sp.]
MEITKNFEVKIMNAFGEDGRRWLDSLEGTVQLFLQKWELTSEGPVNNLSYNYVLKVRDLEGIPLILKLGVPNFDTRNEIQTLQYYNGEGCARLLKYDLEHGVMLLEQLVPGTMLSEETDEAQVISNYIKVWKEIRRQAPSEISTPFITRWFVGLSREEHLNGPIPVEHIQLAKECLKQILETSTVPELLHGDLHHENILFSEQHGWMAIDPKGVIGDSYFDIVSFLVNQLDSKEDPKGIVRFRVDLISEGLGLNRQRLLRAAVALGTLYACWGIEDGDPDWEKTYQCVKWFIEFLE